MTLQPWKRRKAGMGARQGSADGRSVARTTCDYGQREWYTLRRIGPALICFLSSALKLRYSLPIVMPSSKRRDASTRPGTPGSGGGGTPVVSPIASTITFPAGIAPDDAIIFDAPLVARMEEGWELMLERVVFKWMEAVVSERRGER